MWLQYRAYQKNTNNYSFKRVKRSSGFKLTKIWLLPIIMLLFLIPGISTAQLSELEVSKISPDTSIPVFSNYPGMAAVEVRSSLTNLSFTSTWDIVDQLGEPETGRYILIIEPVRQSLIVSAVGFMQARIPLQISEARSVEYFTVEPKNRTITERGTLVVQTDPQGATLELDGVPGQFTSNYTFDDILAQSYILRISLDEHQTEERLVTVTSSRPVLERIDLIPSYGFLLVESEDTRLFLRHESDEREYRYSYRPNESQKLNIGNYTYRATREGYSETSGTFEVKPNEVVRLNPQLDATFGFLNVTAGQNDIDLFIIQEGGLLETQIENPQSANTQLPIGTYRYRATKQYFQQKEGEFDINREGTTNVNITLEPAFGTLRVESNAHQFSLSAIDNEAPPTSVDNEINLESGRHTVRVEASGFATQELSLFIEPGQFITETIQLESFTERESRLARESLPRGLLEIAVDVDADILVDGEKRGVGEIAIALAPGSYDIEVRHPVRSRQFRAEIPSAGVYSELVYLKPSRSGAVTRSLLLPGLGHTYTKRSRGYLYLAAFAGAGAFTYLNHQQQQSLQSEMDELTAKYNSSNSTTEVANVRDEIEMLYPKVNNAHDLKMTGIYATAGLYLLQLADLLIFKPEYGYRESTDSRISLSAGANRVNLTLTFN